MLARLSRESLLVLAAVGWIPSIPHQTGGSDKFVAFESSIGAIRAGWPTCIEPSF